MQERQAREALLLQQKGAEWLAPLAAGEVNPGTAIRAITEGAPDSQRAPARVATEARATMPPL